MLRASFLASLAPHTGDWLFALPFTSCGLRLDDEAVRVAVGLRLCLNLCVPHQCRCGSAVDARGLHSFVCKRAPGKTSRHHALNDLCCFDTIHQCDRQTDGQTPHHSANAMRYVTMRRAVRTVFCQ